jgi:hypothetical protein
MIAQKLLFVRKIVETGSSVKKGVGSLRFFRERAGALWYNPGWLIRVSCEGDAVDVRIPTALPTERGGVLRNE